MQRLFRLMRLTTRIVFAITLISVFMVGVYHPEYLFKLTIASLAIETLSL